MSRLLEEHEDTTLRPSWLIRHAEQLLARVSDTDLPRSAHPRRAVSAAYYAVFHRVVLEVVHSAVPQAGRDVWFPLIRGFAHEDAGRVCGWLLGNPAPSSIEGLVQIARRAPSLVDLSKIVVSLRIERERADYAHEFVIDRQSALTRVGEARTALAALDAVIDEDPAWQAFVALMFLQSQPRKR